MNGKGSKRRPQLVSDKRVQDNWDRIFSGGAKKETPKPGKPGGMYTYIQKNVIE